MAVRRYKHKVECCCCCPGERHRLIWIKSGYEGEVKKKNKSRVYIYTTYTHNNSSGGAHSAGPARPALRKGNIYYDRVMSCALYRMAPPRLTSARKKTNIAPTREREKIERICYIMTRGTKELEHGIWWLLSLSTQRERLVWGSSEASRCRVINRGGDYIKARSPLSVYLHFLAQRQTGKRHYTIWDDDDVHRPFSLSLYSTGFVYGEARTEYISSRRPPLSNFFSGIVPVDLTPYIVIRLLDSCTMHYRWSVSEVGGGRERRKWSTLCLCGPVEKLNSNFFRLFLFVYYIYIYSCLSCDLFRFDLFNGAILPAFDIIRRLRLQAKRFFSWTFEF